MSAQVNCSYFIWGKGGTLVCSSPRTAHNEGEVRAPTPHPRKENWSTVTFEKREINKNNKNLYRDWVGFPAGASGKEPSLPI